MTPEQLNKVHLDWCTDLLHRIYMTARNSGMSDADKLVAITWYAKQGLKVEREE